MDNKIEIFKNEQFGEVRTILIGDEPWFAGKDVALALRYSNPQKAIRDHVDEEDRTVNESFTVHGTPMLQSRFYPQKPKWHICCRKGNQSWITKSKSSRMNSLEKSEQP